MHQSLVQALGIIDCAILRRNAENSFEVLHCTNTWLQDLLPEASLSDSFTFAGNSPFLADFLHDAEEFWHAGNPGQIESGIWSEQTEQELLRLEAVAAVVNHENFLMISNVKQEYERQQKTLQVARELLISNDKILAQHEYVHERLDSLLKQTHDLKELQAPIQQAIESTNNGVMILDASLHSIIQNPASFQLFELPKDNANQQPLDIVLSLFEKQFPEFDRIIATSTKWNGELFWHKPPHINKWLHLAIYPIFDEKQSVKNWIFVASDVTRIKYLLQENEKLTLYDGITNLPNRQYFWQALEQTISTGIPAYVLYIDIKHFKQFNELHGHLAGDELLNQLAQRLSQLIGPNDLIARVGGDEFAIIQSNVHEIEPCNALFERIVKALESPFLTQTQQKYNVDLSIGAAHFPHDAQDAEELMKFADLAVYTAKKSHRSNLKFYSLALKEASMKRLALESALQKAIELNQFELYLQPVLDMQNGKILKAEALLRWHTESGEMISPEVFIPVAEQTGQIIPLGKWVFERACKMLNVLAKHSPQLKLSINLSPRQVSDRHLLDFIKRTIADNNINPSSLELELTEGVLVDDYEKVQLLLDQVRALGMTVAIDDFGTGYSSLSYLQKLPIDHLKIDRSFVRDLESNEGDKAIVLAVIAMAHSLKLGVIAEGVETLQQRQILTDNQCQFAQGFLFSKPVPFDEFCQLLLEQSND